MMNNLNRYKKDGPSSKWKSTVKVRNTIYITYKINFTPRLTTVLINIKGIDTIQEIFIYTLANHSSLHNIH